MLRTDYAHAPQRCVYVMPFGSNIDVARCGWDYWNQEQWQRDATLTLNMTSFHCHCERKRSNQPCWDSLPVDCHAFLRTLTMTYPLSPPQGRGNSKMEV
ncbi:MAG: hypothetical protein K2N54_01670 [Helicobacter sp.]|nr:hypothetical protein [Helicobacter sp.]